MGPRISILAAMLSALTGCATFLTRDVADLGTPPKGVRIYPPRVCLLVGKSSAKLVSLPDFRRAYDVRPLTILAKQDFKVELSDGQLTALTSNQDTTAFLSFLGQAAKTAAEAAGGVSSSEIPGDIGIERGIYCFGDAGTLEPVWLDLKAKAE
jgi:hypothetical protein